MTLRSDVLIVGGGPGGASAAFQLAQRGIRVHVLERAHFPRSKPCAECLSPQASRVLADMGILEAVERISARLRGMIIRAPNGTVIRGDYSAHHGFRPFREHGLAVRREALDELLLARARESGAHVTEGVRVVDVARDASGRVCGVQALGAAASVTEFRAPVVIGADGLRSIVARRLRLARTSVWPRRISLIAHYHGVGDVTDYGEMHVEPDGFVGIADVGNGVTTVAAVFPARRAPEFAGDAGGFLARWLASKAQLDHRFRNATRVGKTRAVGPFASHARQAWHPGAFLAGDAADFFDPFTGEGIYAALRGGELVANAVSSALDGARDPDDAGREYDAARRREFGGKWRVERLIGASVAHPRVINRAARALAGRKHLADLLVGVTGDFVPAGQVLRLPYLAQLFL